MENALKGQSSELDMAILRGELARPLTHECNNFLNNLFLQIALIHETLPPSARPAMDTLLKRGRRLASLVGQWQTFGTTHKGEGWVSLSELLADARRAVCQIWANAEGAIEWQVNPEPLLVQGCAADVRGLCFFVLMNAVSAMTLESPARKVLVEACEAENNIVLRVADNRPGITEQHLEDWFTSAPLENRPLETAVCATLARRLRAEIIAERGPLGGVQIIVTFPRSAAQRQTTQEVHNSSTINSPQ